MKDISDRLYISTIADDCDELALKYGTGLELCEFCTAMNMDPPHFELWNGVVQERLLKAKRVIFHAPFSEIYPSAIDPRAVELAYDRLIQASELAMKYNVKRMVAHGGHLPNVYFPEWFHERSVLFWRRILQKLPDDFNIVIENVLEDRPERLMNVFLEVNDPRLGLCLDVGHTSASTEIPVENWISCLGSNISHVHIHNNYGHEDRHLPLGEGNIDMDYVLTKILEISPNASFTIENRHAASSLEWLEEHGYIGDNRNE